MRRIKSKDTKPELLVRKLVHSMGYRYRLHKKTLPGKPDLVFGPRQKIIFVHGCFWHQHTACRAGRMPASNNDYWRSKLGRNVERDAKVTKSLEKDGWDVLVVWECQTSDMSQLQQVLRTFLD